MKGVLIATVEDADLVCLALAVLFMQLQNRPEHSEVCRRASALQQRLQDAIKAGDFRP